MFFWLFRLIIAAIPTTAITNTIALVAKHTVPAIVQGTNIPALVNVVKDVVTGAIAGHASQMVVNAARNRQALQHAQHGGGGIEDEEAKSEAGVEAEANQG